MPKGILSSAWMPGMSLPSYYRIPRLSTRRRWSSRCVGLWNKKIFMVIFSSRIDSCSLCHTGSIPSLNPYGAAYNSAGRSPAALAAIESSDSDGDGFSNLVEITSLTFPGSSTDRPVSATATNVPPTATAVPPTATAIPATVTGVPPTATNPAPTVTGVPPTAAPGPVQPTPTMQPTLQPGPTPECVKT